MYGTRLTSAFKDDTDAENLWETIVEQRDYSGAITEIEDAAPVPLKFTFADATKNIFDPTKISDVDFSVYATTRFQFVDLAVNDSLKNRIVTKFKGQIYWTGYIITELYEEPLELDSSPITFTAVDLKLLENFEITLEGFNAPRDYIWHCLNKLDFGYDFRMAIPVHAEGFPSFLSVNSNLLQAAAFAGKNCLEVLTELMAAYKANVYQQAGKWHIVQTREKSTNYDYTDYQSDGTLIGSGIYSNIVATSQNRERVNFCDLMAGGSLQQLPGFKEFTVKTALQANEDLILNGDFEVYHPQPSVVIDPPLNYFANWTNNTQVAQIEKDGAKYALIYPVPEASFTLGIWQALNVQYGQIIADVGLIRFKLKFSILANDNLSPNADTSAYVMIKAGDKYLRFNEDENNYFWTDEVNRILLIDSRGESINELTFKTFEARAEIIAGPYEVRFLGGYYPQNPPSKFELVGPVFGGVSVDFLNADGTELPDEIEDLNTINANNNFTPDDVEIAFDIPETEEKNIYEKYSNLLFPSSKQEYNGIIGTLAQLAAQQIKDVYTTPPLLLRANIESDIFNFDSVLTDIEFPGLRFLPTYAVFFPKYGRWVLEAITINGEQTPDFSNTLENPDFDDDDFYTGN